MSDACVKVEDIEPLLQAAGDLGLDTAALVPAGANTIPIIDYFRFQRTIALASDDLTAVISSRKLTYRTGHFLLTQMQQAGSLLTTLETLAEHMNMMHGDAYNSLRYSDDRVSLVVDDSQFPYRSRENTAFVELVGDCLTIKIHCLLDSLTEGLASTALKRIRLKRKRGIERQPQNSFWQVPIEYGAPAYELIYDFDRACETIRIREKVDLSADGVFSRVIGYLETRLPQAGEQSFTARTLDLIDDGMTLQSEVADRLDVSVATLRRRLAEEGAHFRELVLNTKLRRAEAMLRRGCSVAHTTEVLDYSDIRAFNRAFKRWKGQTPAAFAQTCQS
ncbi:helix-turn-helix domain-containing protein [Henriciella litoralis]|uniref:helix-turn-helix domain-containing protein n=1 Tax=Henriciella litoralis TaxID=568102 RepID=UPI0009FFE589|nr:helix-turn-helix domain-containing protein [Henriciella litoralis]